MTKATATTDKPADARGATPQGAAPQGAAVPASGRLRVTQRDLDMYAALVGVPTTLLIPDEPTLHDGARSASARAWQSVTHAVGGLTVRLGRPDLPAWVRRISGHAKRQIRQARRRLTAPTPQPPAAIKNP